LFFGGAVEPTDGWEAVNSWHSKNDTPEKAQQLLYLI
jgi:hypothetical protein